MTNVLPHIPKSDAFDVLEYPGFGNREGKPGRTAMNAAATHAFFVLRAQYSKPPLGVIPFDHSRRLAKGKTQAKMYSLPCSHNEWSLRPEVQVAHGPT